MIFRLVLRVEMGSIVFVPNNEPNNPTTMINNSSTPSVSEAAINSASYFASNPNGSCVALFVETTEGLFKFNRDGSFAPFSIEELKKLIA